MKKVAVRYFPNSWELKLVADFLSGNADTIAYPIDGENGGIESRVDILFLGFDGSSGETEEYRKFLAELSKEKVGKVAFFATPGTKDRFIKTF